MRDYATALGLTLVIELPVYAGALTRRALRRWREAVLIGLGVNLVSHPIAFLVLFPNLDDRVGDVMALAVTELAVVVGETAMMMLRRIPPRVALVTSAVANIASLVLGAALIR